MCSVAASRRASIGIAPIISIAQVRRTRIAAAQSCGHRTRAVRQSATREAAAATAEPHPDQQGTASLSQTDLQRMLRLRGLSIEGSEAELQERLSAYLSEPSSFPEATCTWKPVKLLGGRLFGGQGMLRSHIQLLLNVLLGDDVREGHPDFAFLLALLQQHPRYAEKVHPPVVAFRVQSIEDADLRPYRCFEFLDSRGQWDDFSYRKCIGMNSDHNAELSFQDAMRFAVADQLNAFRLASVKTGTRGQQVHVCDCCSKRVRGGHLLRLVHVNPSFHKLVRDFCESTSLPRPPVDGTVPNSKRRCFSDERWLAEWRAYHRKHVRQLQLVCKKCLASRKEAEGKADAGGQAAEQPAEQHAEQPMEQPEEQQQQEQHWDAWTVQQREAAPAGQLAERHEAPEGRQHGQQQSRLADGRSQPRERDGWQPRVQQRKSRERLEQQAAAAEQGQWRESQARSEPQAMSRGQWLAPDVWPRRQVDVPSGRQRWGEGAPMEQWPAVREQRRSPGLPPPQQAGPYSQRRVPPRWQQQQHQVLQQQQDWLGVEAAQWQAWHEEEAQVPEETMPAELRATQTAQQNTPSPANRRTAPQPQRQAAEEQAQVRVPPPIALQQQQQQQQRQQRGPGRQAVSRQAPPRQAPLLKLELASDAFASAETDAWLSGEQQAEQQ